MHIVYIQDLQNSCAAQKIPEKTWSLWVNIFCCVSRDKEKKKCSEQIQKSVQTKNQKWRTIMKV